MKINIKNGDDFRRLLTALLDELVDAQFSFSLHQNLAIATGEYAMEFSQSNTFWQHTFAALMDAVMLRLCKAYDQFERFDPAPLNLRNFLHTIEANLNIFDEPNFRQRLKGNAFVDSLAAQLKRPDKAQLQCDIAAVSNSDPLVSKLVMWRNGVVAHRSSAVALNPNAFATQYPLSFAQIKELLDRALMIGNRYSLLFDASAHSTMMIGRDDYLSILKAIREHVQASERRFEELKQTVSAGNSEVF